MRLWPEVSRRSRFQVVLGTKGSSNYHNTLLVICFFFFNPLEGKVSGFYQVRGHYQMTQSLGFFFFTCLVCILCIIVLSLSFGVLYVWL